MNEELIPISAYQIALDSSEYHDNSDGEVYQVSSFPVYVSVKKNQHENRYLIIEPPISDEEQVWYESLTQSLKIQLKNLGKKRIFREDFNQALHSLIHSSVPDITESSISILTYYLSRDAKGFGRLQPYLDDPHLISIHISGSEEPVVVEHETHGRLETSFTPDDSDLRKFIRKAENRSGCRANLDNLPCTLPLPEYLLEISSSQYLSASPFSLRFSRPGKKAKESIIPEKDTKKIIAETTYLNNIATGVLEHLDNGKYRYIVRFSTPNQQERRVLQDCISFFSDEREELSLSEIRKRLNKFLLTTHPEITAEQRERIITLIILKKAPEQWIRLFITDPAILSITCPGSDRYVRILHGKIPTPVITNIKLQKKEIEGLIRFFSNAAKKPAPMGDGTVTFSFSGGIRVRITKDQNGVDGEVVIHKNQAVTDTDSASSIDTVSGHSSSVPDTKTDEILSKVFDLEEQNRDAYRVDLQEQEQNVSEENKTWLDKIGRRLRFKTPGVGFRRRKTRPDPNAVVPEPSSPQVRSVLDFQIPEGLIAEEAYWLVSPHAYVVILKDPAGDRIYRIIEPDLSPRERIVLEETHETLRDVLIYDKPVSKGDLFLDFDEAAKVIKTYDPKITDDRLSVLYYYLKRNLNGYGKVDPLMHDEMLEDISCNGHHLPVYIHHRIYNSIPTSVFFEQEDLNRFVLKLSQKADKQVSLTSPLLDAALPNGSRAQITYSNVVSTKGSSFTIRKFRSDPMTPITLLGFGTYDPDLLAYLWLTLENRKSLIVVGGTASGKTSAMNALSFFIPHNSKIVSLEDTRELQIPHRNWLPVQTRESVALHERGNIDMFDLLKASLRQRPEYIIVGEVRGKEAQTLFQAMNSGHTTISTLHAGTVEEALNRLTNEPINVPPAMFGALDLMVIQSFHYREGRMIRRCDAIHEIFLSNGDKLEWNTLFEYNPATDGFDRKYRRSKTLDSIRYMHNWSENDLHYHLAVRKKFLTQIRHQPRSDPVKLMQYITRLRRMA